MPVDEILDPVQRGGTASGQVEVGRAHPRPAPESTDREHGRQARKIAAHAGGRSGSRKCVRDWPPRRLCLDCRGCAMPCSVRCRLFCLSAAVSGPKRSVSRSSAGCWRIHQFEPVSVAGHISGTGYADIRPKVCYRRLFACFRGRALPSRVTGLARAL
jgi:hypothetical protein